MMGGGTHRVDDGPRRDISHLRIRVRAPRGRPIGCRLPVKLCVWRRHNSYSMAWPHCAEAACVGLALQLPGPMRHAVFPVYALWIKQN